MSFIADPVTFIINWLQGVLSNWGLGSGWVMFIMYALGALLLTIGPMLLTVGLIWVERKLGGRFQDRLGPNRVGPWGVFQTIADMLKIFTKEYITPIGADKVLYNLAPVLAVGAVLGVWAVVPLSSTVFGSNINVGVLYIMAVGAIGELGVILAGFGSNNKYALLGGFRAVAQLISYEVPMVLALLVPVMLSGSMGLNDIAGAQKVPFVFLVPAAALVFFVAAIAENGRAPFDLMEADSEIVAGFNIEYSGLKFGMFYVADFLHAFTSALVFSTIFLGGWQGPGAEQYPILGFIYLMIKTVIVYVFLLGVRFTLPRFRIDQMMAINWKLLTPLAMAAILVTAIVDKVTLGGFGLVRVGALLVSNLAVLLIGNWLLGAYIRSHRTRRLVVSEPRPVVVAPPKPVNEAQEVNA